MDALARLTERLAARHTCTTTLRPGVAFAYFGKGTGLEIRVGEEGDFDCTVLCPQLPVRTLRVTAREIMELAEELAAGDLERGMRRGGWL